MTTPAPPKKDLFSLLAKSEIEFVKETSSNEDSCLTDPLNYGDIESDAGRKVVKGGATAVFDIIESRIHDGRLNFILMLDKIEDRSAHPVIANCGPDTVSIITQIKVPRKASLVQSDMDRAPTPAEKGRVKKYVHFQGGLVDLNMKCQGIRLTAFDAPNYVKCEATREGERYQQLIVQGFVPTCTATDASPRIFFSGNNLTVQGGRSPAQFTKHMIERYGSVIDFTAWQQDDTESVRPVTSYQQFRVYREEQQKMLEQQHQGAKNKQLLGPQKPGQVEEMDVDQTDQRSKSTEIVRVADKIDITRKVCEVLPIDQVVADEYRQYVQMGSVSMDTCGVHYTDTIFNPKTARAFDETEPFDITNTLFFPGVHHSIPRTACVSWMGGNWWGESVRPNGTRVIVETNEVVPFLDKANYIKRGVKKDKTPYTRLFVRCALMSRVTFPDSPCRGQVEDQQTFVEFSYPEFFGIAGDDAWSFQRCIACGLDKVPIMVAGVLDQDSRSMLPAQVTGARTSLFKVTTSSIQTALPRLISEVGFVIQPDQVRRHIMNTVFTERKEKFDKQLFFGQGKPSETRMQWLSQLNSKPAEQIKDYYTYLKEACGEWQDLCSKKQGTNEGVYGDSKGSVWNLTQSTCNPLEFLFHEQNSGKVDHTGDFTWFVISSYPRRYNPKGKEYGEVRAYNAQISEFIGSHYSTEEALAYLAEINWAFVNNLPSVQKEYLVPKGEKKEIPPVYSDVISQMREKEESFKFHIIGIRAEVGMQYEVRTGNKEAFSGSSSTAKRQADNTDDAKDATKKVACAQTLGT